MRFLIRAPEHRAFDESPGTLRLAGAAKTVFLRSGDSDFSIRNVAKEARMSVGAVQHYFPTREKLLAAMLEFVVNDYEHTWERVFSTFPYNGEARLLATIDYLAGDLCEQETRMFFFSLWALSCHNKSVAALVDEVYLHHRRNLATFIGAARPALSEHDCFEAATEIGAMIEGLMIFTGADTKHSLARATIAKKIKSVVARLVPANAPIAKASRKSRSLVCDPG